MYQGAAGQQGTAVADRCSAFNQDDVVLARMFSPIGQFADCGCDRSGLELNQGAGLPHCRKRSDPHPADRPESSFTNSERRAARHVVERRSDDNLLKEWDRKEWRDAEPRMAEIFSSFLRKAETDRSEPEREQR